MANDHSTGNACPNKTSSLRTRKQLAENVRVLRMMHGWSQEALAEARRLIAPMWAALNAESETSA